jgi:transposase
MARLKKKAHCEGRKVVFIDESGFYLLPAVVRSYAPIGQTPLLKVPLTNDHLSVMSAISLNCHVYSLVRTEAITRFDTVVFLHHLLACMPGKLLIIWDGSPIHRAIVVKDFLAKKSARRIHVERFPPYAPDLNPAEGVWHYLKHVEMGNLCCSDLGNLHTEFSLAFERLRSKPHIINGFFGQSKLVL